MIDSKQILFYDNLFSMVQRDSMYQFVRNSKFQIGWRDSPRIELSGYQNLHSVFSQEDVENLGLLRWLKGSEVEEKLSGLEYDKTVVNLSTPSDVNFIHVHHGQVVLLYYPNLDWKPEWYGETLFYSEDGASVSWAGAYTPGRVLLFDGEIPHSIRPQSSLAPHYRFTVACVFRKPA